MKTVCLENWNLGLSKNTVVMLISVQTKNDLMEEKMTKLLNAFVNFVEHKESFSIIPLDRN